MKKKWLWDTNLDEKTVGQILKNENHPKFIIYAEKLLSRSNDARNVFSLIEKGSFCKKWPQIKKRLRRNKWAKDKVVFWQVFYDRIKEQLQGQGIRLRREDKYTAPQLRKDLAVQIKKMRKSLGYTQQDIADQLGVAQQYVSKIEKGKENISVNTLIRLASVFNRKVIIRLK